MVGLPSASAMPPLAGRGEGKAEAPRAHHQRLERRGDVRVHVVKKQDVAAGEGLALEPAADRLDRAGGEVLGIAVPQDHRLPEGPKARELAGRELAVRRTVEER